eukprot:513498-Karenia_brevis.AAC.1
MLMPSSANGHQWQHLTVKAPNGTDHTMYVSSDKSKKQVRTEFVLRRLRRILEARSKSVFAVSKAKCRLMHDLKTAVV